jgi:amidase
LSPSFFFILRLTLIFRASETVGKSAIGGQGQSAYVRGPAGMELEHSNPGGSSNGSAVAVSAGYAPLSIGSEADGSTTLPGSRAALYAIVMTRETISMEGYFAISPTYASPSCFAKTSGDLINLVKVMLEASNAKDKTVIPDQYTMAKGWEGIKLGFVNHDYEPIPTEWTGLTENEVLEEACLILVSS